MTLIRETRITLEIN